MMAVMNLSMTVSPATVCEMPVSQMTVRADGAAIVAQSILALPRKGLPARSSSCGDPKGECNA